MDKAPIGSTLVNAPGVATPTPWSLQNGRYHVLVHADGTGFSSCDGLLLSRWSGDPLRADDGFFLYLRDLDTGEFWSQTSRPAPDNQAVYGGHAEDRRIHLVCRRREILADVQIGIHPKADLEIRRLVLHNRGPASRRLEVTTWVEPVLHEAAAHEAHPVFSRLFLETTLLERICGLAVRRRPRGAGETFPCLVHALAGGRDVQYETDRGRFLGRWRTPSNPLALREAGAFSGSPGCAIDPVLCLRATVSVEPDAPAVLSFVLGTFPDAPSAQQEIAHLSDPAVLGRVLGAPRPLEAVEQDLPPAGEKSRRDAKGSVSPAEAAGTDSSIGARTASEGGAAMDMAAAWTAEELLFDNGCGGFSRDGKVYVIRLRPGANGFVQPPPAPWVNVLANPSFGVLASERGSLCTWSGNSRENRLTPWHNDPVIDPTGEAVYLRDRETGEIWSPLPGPVVPQGSYEVRHALGSTVWSHEGQGIRHETTLFVDAREACSVMLVRLRNLVDRRRSLDLASYRRLVIGGGSAPAALQIGLDLECTALYATRPGGEDRGIAAFAALLCDRQDLVVSHTGDNAEFLGGKGAWEAPAGVRSPDDLSGRLGGELDPCFAQKCHFDLEPGQTIVLTLLFGTAPDLAAVRKLVRRFRGADRAQRALRTMRRGWEEMTGRLQIRTPDPALDLMANHWLVYQNLSCRLRGRTAFYQSGGAFGFRDQLQDALALLPLDPAIARAQILLHAAHQFVEGDVLHWWHPPRSRGIRTRFADDLLWLPLAVVEYLDATGDEALLAKRVTYLEARALEPGEDEAFLEPRRSEVSGDIYDHCCRALDRGGTPGAHGLPLFGTGDWNDGMNRVGRLGRGESVWMGFFLYKILGGFAPLCRRRGDEERADRYDRRREGLRDSLEAHAWDGAWYLRGYYDNGEPLGSSDSEECRIDALAQAWSVLSGAASPERARQAMEEVEARLISEPDRIIRLLHPPFDRTAQDPGYIKGYAPGVRENGGQYTHAALWVVQALARLGKRDRCARLLRMLTPVAHTATREDVERYRVEPYVVAADVYGAVPYVGRGGWTWYTGSAGWMYRAILESLLGLTLHAGEAVRLQPGIPDDWPSFEIQYKTPRGSVLRIAATRGAPAGSAVREARIDGAPLPVEDGAVLIPFGDRGKRYDVRVVLG